MTINTLYYKEKTVFEAQESERGLGADEVKASREKYGENILPRAKREKFFKKLFETIT